MRSLPLFRRAIFPVFLASLGFSNAEPVANWKQLNPSAGPVTDPETDSPTYGNGTDSSAQSNFVAGRFGTVAAPVTVNLAIGQTLTVSGDLTLTGGTGGNSDYRFGIFNDGGQFALDANNNWTGGWLHQTGTDIFRGRTDGPYISSLGNAAATRAVRSSTGTLNKDSPDPLTFTMSVTRMTDTTVEILSTFVGGGGDLDQTYNATEVTTDNFTYTCVGLLFGGGSRLDLAELSGVSYTVTSSPSGVPLQITSLTREVVTEPANIVMTLEFTSDPAKTYTLYRTNDLETPLASQTIVSDSIQGAPGQEITSFPIDFNLYGIPLETAGQFFTVAENSPSP